MKKPVIGCRFGQIEATCKSSFESHQTIWANMYKQKKKKKVNYHLILLHFLSQLHPLASIISFSVSRFAKAASKSYEGE